jgi:hypothetical protein
MIEINTSSKVHGAVKKFQHRDFKLLKNNLLKAKA